MNSKLTNSSVRKIINGLKFSNNIPQIKLQEDIINMVHFFVNNANASRDLSPIDKVRFENIKGAAAAIKNNQFYLSSAISKWCAK